MAKSKQIPPMVDRLLHDVDETCYGLNISRATFYKEVKAGELETTRIGDRQYTTAQQRAAFVARKQRQTARAS